MAHSRILALAASIAYALSMLHVPTATASCPNNIGTLHADAVIVGSPSGLARPFGFYVTGSQGLAPGNAWILWDPDLADQGEIHFYDGETGLSQPTRCTDSFSNPPHQVAWHQPGSSTYFNPRFSGHGTLHVALEPPSGCQSPYLAYPTTIQARSTDLDVDGDTDQDDKDELRAAILAGSTDVAQYDLNVNGAVDTADYRILQLEMKRENSWESGKPFCGGGGGGEFVYDYTAPNAISDLTATWINANTIRLRWTAPGDDASMGTCGLYWVRWSNTLITPFSLGSLVPGTPPKPLTPGTVQTFDVTLTTCTAKYFAIWTFDLNNNLSPISNVFYLPSHAIPQAKVEPQHCTGTTPVVVEIPWLGTSTTLSTSQFRVENASGSGAGNATPTSACRDFVYDPPNEHYFEANAFYWVGKFLHEWLPARGFGGLSYQLPVLVNYPTGPPQYIPDSQPGEKRLELPGNTAVASDAIIHEVTHALTEDFGLIPAAATEVEIQALWEGLSHYFTAAFKNSSVIYTCPGSGCIWDLDNNPAYVNYQYLNAWQNLDPSHRPCWATNGPHPNGMILASALWDLRKALPAKADRLVIEGLRDFMAPQGNFDCLASAVYAANLAYHSGQDGAMIRTIFQNRGLPAAGRRGVSIPFDALTTTAGNPPPTAQATLSADWSCGGPPSDLHWWKRCRECGTLATYCGDWEDLGTGASVPVSSSKNFDVKMTWTEYDGAAYEYIKTIRVLHGPDPTVQITGPSTLGPNDPDPQYCATVTGQGPFTYQWSIDICNPDLNPPDCGNNALGTSPCQTVPNNGVSFTMLVTVTDADCRNAYATQFVSAQQGAFAVPIERQQQSQDSRLRIKSEQGVITLGDHLTGSAKLLVFDVAGRVVARPWRGVLRGSGDEIEWSTSQLSRGMYFYRLELGDGSVVRAPFVVLK